MVPRPQREAHMLSMGILVFDDVELLDIAAPQAVFAGVVLFLGLGVFFVSFCF